MDIKSKSTDTELIEQAKEKPKQFSEEDLKGFTKCFDTPIGSGGFGIVYKGEFPSGEQIAVKVLTAQNVPDELFMEEVRITGMTSHPNLIKLYGFCCDSNMRGLVYEYMENGSLDRLFYKGSLPIEWDTLYDITIHTADGISYLHDGCKERIVHHDIKPANILLGSKHFPKVADFGLAKNIERDLTHFTVSGPKGTRGYVAPEMIMMSFSHVTYKCDVYSFGMMLFDVLGMSSINQNDEWFPEKVWKEFEKRHLNKFMENCGIKEKHKEKVEILSMVAFWCVQFTPDIRPSMNTVVKMLKKEVQIEMPGNPFLPFSGSTDQPSREGNEDPNAIVGQQVPTRVKKQRRRQQQEPTNETLGIIMKYVIHDSRVSRGKPVAALIIHKCFLQWDSLIINLHPLLQLIVSLEEKDALPYWLSNTSMLLTLLWRKYTGNIFGQICGQLDDCIKESYCTIRDNLKKDLTSLLSICIQAPTASVSITSIDNQSPTSSWQHIVDILNTYLRKLKENFVSSYLIKNIFSQTFYYINVELFNNLMLHRECCSFSNGENVEVGLSLLKSWCDKASKEYAGTSWKELKHIRTATEFLVKEKKSNLSVDDIRLMSSLYMDEQQQFALCTQCWDEENSANCVADHVLLELLEVQPESVFSHSDSDSYDRNSLLLEDDSSIMIFDTELVPSLEKVELPNVPSDVELLKYPAFLFLTE